MIRTPRQLSGRRSKNVMEGVLHVSKSPYEETQSSVKACECHRECGEFDNGSPASLLSADIASSGTTSSSSHSGPEGEGLLPLELHNLQSQTQHLSNHVPAANSVANLLLPKGHIWSIGDSDYSWASETLSQSGASMADASFLSSDTPGSNTSFVLQTPKAGNSLVHQWPLHNATLGTASIHNDPLPAYQRRSWQPTSKEDQPSVALLEFKIRGLPACSNSVPSLPSSSCLDASKVNMVYVAEECSMGNSEYTSVYDSMARKIHDQMSGFNARSGSTTKLSSVGFPTLQTSQETVGLTKSSNNSSPNSLRYVQDQNFRVASMDYEKTYLTSGDSCVFFNQNSPTSILDVNAIMDASASNEWFRENSSSPKSLLDSTLGTQDYLHSTKKKIQDPVQSWRKWPHDASAGTGAGTGVKEFTADTPCRGNLEWLPHTPGGSILGAKEHHGHGVYHDSTRPPATGKLRQQSISLGLVSTRDDSRKQLLHMSKGQLSNNTSYKRLRMETGNGQALVPPASVKRSSSWASSLTSTCSMDQDSRVNVAGSVLPYTKASSRHAVGPALNTNLKPRARQGSANDPQSIAARVRRERISDRLKVLEELIPNGSKVDLVTMLEKAISHVKFLQLQVKMLTTDDYWPSNEKGVAAAPSAAALLNFEGMAGASKVSVARVETETETEADMNYQNN